jgi:putative nucleotidyltransferase with HDIG domain
MNEYIRRKEVLPNKEQALALLYEAYEKNPGPWKNHSIVVAECAYAISRQCDGLDEDKSYVIGLLHDIGRREGVTNLAHVIDGYRYLMKLGHDEAARICITHSFADKDINTYIGSQDVSNDDLQIICSLINGYEYDDYDRLIQLCDSIALPDGPVRIEVRMNDVKQRYGYYPLSKWNKHIELKAYFEKKSGLDIDFLIT